MKKGVLIVNHFLKNTKFDELYEWLKKSTYELDIKLSVLTNRELMFDSLQPKLTKDKVDFILFWDKDILLAKNLENQGFRLFNSASAIENCDDKALMHIALTDKGILCPRTIVPPFTFEKKWNLKDAIIIDFIDEIIKTLGFPLIIKARKGSFGTQVHLVNNTDDLYNTINKYDSNDILFQEYIQQSHGRDMRLQVVGDKVVTAMLRYSDNDFRANISNGGKMKLIEPSKEAIDMAIKATKALGLDFAGVDILFGEDDKPILCEVNSNAHFVNIYNCTGVNVADCIMQYINKVIKDR